MKPNWDRMCALADEEIAAIMTALPSPLRERAEKLPVALERRPSNAMQADDVEPDTLGLFTGPEWADTENGLLPPQIILYLENIWEAAETDEQRFRDEIATTFLHELGHFFGFDEAGLGALGLE